MRRFQADHFSAAYSVRLLNKEDVPAVSVLCGGNTQYYDYCGLPFSEDTILRDMCITPPGKTLKDKYYAGYFVQDRLCAVIDLIDGYPDAETAFIGFFMLERTLQGTGRGTAMITELCDYLRRTGVVRIRLGIDRDNPQSMHFWKKNGFCPLQEIVREDGVIVLAQKML